MASTITYSSFTGKAASSGLSDQVVAETASFAYDATPSAMDVYSTKHMEGGHLSGVGIVFGSTPPNTLTISIADSFGVVVASGTIVSAGRMIDFAPQPFIGNLTVTLTGNTTASATGAIALYAF